MTDTSSEVSWLFCFFKVICRSDNSALLKQNVPIPQLFPRGIATIVNSYQSVLNV